jgi:hypothetical protein
MRFEHIIQLNDPRQPQLPAVDAGALFAALVRSAAQPQLLRPDLDAVQVLALSNGHWQRRLRFGGIEILDEVIADTQAGRLAQHTLAPPPMAGMRRIVCLEQPAPGHLILRFIYEDPRAHERYEPAQLEMLAAAWRHADIEQVGMLRGMV